MNGWPINLGGDREIVRLPEHGGSLTRLVQSGAGYAAARVSDLSRADADRHGCPACPHPCVGPALEGSPTVFINNLPALRVGDKGAHSACCGPNMWRSAAGSGSVFINGKSATRKGDEAKHCGGQGKLITGSPDVQFGD